MPRKALYALLMTAALIGVWASSVAADDGTTASTCEAGTHAVEPVSVEPLPDGGRTYIYVISGVTTSVPVPPPDFDPLSAPADQLAEYGYPPRPDASDPEALAYWQQDLSTYERPAVPNLCEADQGSPNAFYQPADEDPSKVDPLDDSNHSSNWAGFAKKNDPNNNTWIAATGEFDQPNAGTESCNDAHESSWVGIGGFHPNPGSLIQLGTDTGHGYGAWYEVIGSNDFNYPVYTTMNVNPDDHMHFYVAYERANNKINFYFHNETTGGTRTFVLANKGPQYYDGASAEFIDERPTASYGPTPLKNYHHVDWSHAQVQRTDGSWHDLGEGDSATRIKMFNGGHLLSVPSGLATGSNASFTDDYRDCS